MMQEKKLTNTKKHGLLTAEHRPSLHAAPASRHRFTLLVLAGLLIACIAILAAANLWYLRRLQHESLHSSAAESVLSQGADLARTLAEQPAVSDPNDDPKRWTEFARFVRSLRRIEPAMDYVTVAEGDVIVFHDSAGIVGTNTAASTAASPGKPPEVRVGRQRIAKGDSVIPVLTFTAPAGRDGAPRQVRVALRKEAVDRREQQAAEALGILFRITMATLVVSFGLAALLSVGILRHEIERQRRERAAEHLAFAGAIADGIIHDVRNPLSSLRLDLQMLEKEVLKGQAGNTGRTLALAERTLKTMERIDMVMREFLYVSMPESADRERVDVNDCVHDCLDLLGARFEAAGVRLRAELSADRLVFEGFGVGIKRALINILTNAKQASPQGGTVTVRTSARDGQAVIEVEDEGRGIPRRQMKRLFEMFASGRPDGIGLGLHLAKAAVERSGGAIAAENRAGNGAQFTIRLPLVARETHGRRANDEYRVDLRRAQW